MKVTMLKENDDGSADIQLDDISPAMMQLIIQTGFIKLLEDMLQREKEAKRMPALFKKTTYEK